jgi:hypothetical protein
VLQPGISFGGSHSTVLNKNGLISQQFCLSESKILVAFLKQNGKKGTSFNDFSAL